MPRGIIIFGSAGSGKTTLGRMVADKLNYTYFDIDDYIWRKDTNNPYTVMYTKEEKINNLMNDIYKHEHFVMAGSMDSFNEPFVPLFDLAVHLTAPAKIRVKRVNYRAIKNYGNRVLQGGDMYEDHLKFLESIAKYDTNGSPSMKVHLAWGNSLPCKVLHLNGEEDLFKNLKTIVDEYNLGQ